MYVKTPPDMWGDPLYSIDLQINNFPAPSQRCESTKPKMYTISKTHDAESIEIYSKRARRYFCFSFVYMPELHESDNIKS